MTDETKGKFSSAYIFLFGVLFFSSMGLISGGTILQYYAGAGLELDSFRVFSLKTTCDSYEVLKWNSTNSDWVCSGILPKQINIYNKTCLFDNGENWDSGLCGNGVLNGWNLCNSTFGDIERSIYSYSGDYAVVATRFTEETETLTRFACFTNETTEAWISFYWVGYGLDSGEYGEVRLKDTNDIWHVLFSINNTNSLSPGNPSPSDYNFKTIDLMNYDISGNVTISWFFNMNLANEKVYFDNFLFKFKFVEDSLELGTSLFLSGDLIPDISKKRNIGSYDNAFDYVFADDFVTLSDFDDTIEAKTELLEITSTERIVPGIFEDGTTSYFTEKVVDYSSLPDWVREDYVTNEEGIIMLDKTGEPMTYLIEKGVNINRLLMVVIKELQDESKCPEGFTKYELGCIQTIEQEPNGYEGAINFCSLQYGARLPNYSELYLAFINEELIGEKDNRERISEITGQGCGYIDAKTSFNTIGFSSCGEFLSYRCFIPA